MANSPITTQSELGQFLAGMRAKFYEVMDQDKESARQWDIAQLFKTTPNVAPLVRRINAAGQQKIEFTGVTGILGYLEPTGELEPFKESAYLHTYITSVQPYQFTKRIRVSRQAVERTDPSYRNALNEASKLLSVANRTLSLHTADLFNHLRTAPANLPVHLFVYGDGVKLASTAHPLKGGGTVSNCLATSPALTHESLKDAILLGQNTKDDTGKPMPFFNGTFYIVANPSLAAKIFEILNTGNVPYTANYIANVFHGAGGVGVTTPYITSTTQWTLVDGMASPIVQVIFKDITAEDWFDDNVKAYVYDVSAEWKVGAIDFRGIVHSVGDGSTITD